VFTAVTVRTGSPQPVSGLAKLLQSMRVWPASSASRG
jgi:hypothetical protein